MGWKGVMRSMEADSRRRQREADRRQKELEKMKVLQQAEYEAKIHEDYINSLKSVHKSCSQAIDWKAMKESPPPKEPQNLHKHESKAQEKLENFKPGIFNRMLRNEESKKATLAKEVEKAKERDDKEHKDSLEIYRLECLDWEESKKIATRLLSGELAAYKEAIEKMDPFSKIEELGRSIQFNFENTTIFEADLYVNDDEVIPKEVKSLRASGKLSVKKMPQAKFHELYQDYICSCTLRVARELFALLPIEMAIINAMKNLLNTKTGHKEDQPIISVAISRETLKQMNLHAIDPSDSMSNFVNHMSFKRTQGFAPVERIKPSDFQNTQ